MIDALFSKHRKASKKQPRRNKTPLSEEVNKVIKWLMMTLLIMLVSSGAIFLWGMSTTAQDGYSLVQSSTVHDTLETENRTLKLRVLEAQAFKNMQDSDVFGAMEKPE